ncbi:MAG: hypothetical protein R2849_23710 [Thermomicrobiales bacterium]
MVIRGSSILPLQAVDASALGGSGGFPPRLWIDWEPVEELFVVVAVHDPDLAHLLGTRLESIDGVPFADLSARMCRLRGDDNVYNNLVHLTEALGHPTLLFELLESASHDTVTLRCVDHDGGERKVEVAWVISPARRADCAAVRAIDLEPTGPGHIAWQPLDDVMLPGWFDVLPGSVRGLAPLRIPPQPRRITSTGCWRISASTPDQMRSMTVSPSVPPRAIHSPRWLRRCGTPGRID